ncbi:MAG TPA: MFS transporter [Rhizomicrobium sp.]|nr:MFS transporter [Rhizomicrobium sp.]
MEQLDDTRPAPERTAPPPSLSSSASRWGIAVLLFLAMTLNYFDRQMIAFLKPLLSHELRWSEADYANIITAFQAAYAASYLLLGRFVDRFGAKAGFAFAFAIWSVAQIAHGFARSVTSFMAARVLLGLGEGGAYPAGLTAIAHWFAKSERAFATGLFNAGVNIGVIATPLIVPPLVLNYGWRPAFVLTGIASLVWLGAWLILYRAPQDAIREEAHRFDWSILLRRREAWAYAIAKFIIDPIWWMFLFWLPDFFAKRYGLDLKTFGPPLILIYVLSDVGSLAGGWFSSHLIKRGLSTNDARKTTMLVCALLATPVAFAMQAHTLWMAAGVIGLAAAAHQAFSVNLFTFPSDVFPRRAVGSVIGFGGMLGAIGGMAIAQFTGWVLGTLHTYGPLFALAGLAYLVALLVIHLLSPRMAVVELSRG